MFYRSALSIGLALAVLPSLASAAVFERDWKVKGDGLLTFDDVNQREWLDLSETLLLDFLPGTTAEQLYQNVIANVEPGGLFESFIVGSIADVEQLAVSAGIVITTKDFAENEIPVGNLIELLGSSLANPEFDQFSLGMLNDVVAGDPVRRRNVSSLYSGRIFSLNRRGLSLVL